MTLTHPMVAVQINQNRTVLRLRHLQQTIYALSQIHRYDKLLLLPLLFTISYLPRGATLAMLGFWIFESNPPDTNESVYL